MNTYHRRYIFVDFDNLLKVKFKKLEKVCDRVFVFIRSNEDSIPFALVQHMQKMGKAVKWIVHEPANSEAVNFIISFFIGRLHQKVDKMIEFAVLSNDVNFDPLVTYINHAGRSCLRVKREKNEPEYAMKGAVGNGEEFDKKERNGVHGFDSKNAFSADGEAVEVIEKTAEETIKRLIRSGNRPSSVHMLKDYILLSNSELTQQSNADKVIRKLEADNEINIQDEEVIYHF